MANLRVPLSWMCAVLFLVCVGCGGGSSTSSSGGNGGTVSGLLFTAPPTSPTIELGQSVNFTVSQPSNWVLQSGTGTGKACGTLTANSAATTATYTAVSFGAAAPCTVNTQTSCGAFSSPPSPQRVTIVATSVADSTQSASISVLVNTSTPCVAVILDPTLAVCPPAGTVIPPSANLLRSLPVGAQLSQVGIFTQFPISDGGGQSSPLAPFGIAPYTWAITSGSLPAGLVLSPGADTSKVSISGTPVSPGCSNVTVQITDATGVSANQSFNIAVIPAALKVQTPSFANSYLSGPPATSGFPYPPTALLATGGVPPYNWTYNQVPVGAPDFPGGLCLVSAQGSVPAGCANSAPPSSSSIGVISGVPLPSDLAQPNQPITYPVQLQVSDSQQPYPAVALPNLNMNVDFLRTSCSPSPDLQPSAANGGINGAGNVPAVTYLQGSYAFLMRGFDANGPVVIAASVNLDGAGNVTGGVEDVLRRGSSQSLPITSGSYVIGGSVNVYPGANSYDRGCMTLTNQANTTSTFAFSLGGCSNDFRVGGAIETHDTACGMTQNNGLNVAAGYFTTGRVIEFDDSTGTGTRGSGILRWQDTSSFSNSALSGSQAFGLSGWDASNGHYALAGSIKANGGNFTAAAADINDAGTLSSQLTGGTGTYNIAANGRGTASLTIGQSSFNLAIYMVSSHEAIVTTIDPLSAGHPLAAGEVISSSGSFTNASLANSHMFHISGLSTSGPDVSVGVLTFDGVSSLSGTVYEDQAGTLGTTAVSGIYSVDSNTGRASFSAPQNGQTLGPHPFVAYIAPLPSNATRAACSKPASCITGFLVGTDSTAQDGVLEFQTSLAQPPPPFSNSYVAGDYVFGNHEILDETSKNIAGDLSSSTTSLSNIVENVSYGTANYCLQSHCLLLIPDETFSSTSFSITKNGTGTVGAQTVAITNGNVIFYIDESPLNLHPTITVAEQ